MTFGSGARNALLLACVAASTACAIERKVLIVGIDGVRPDALIAANTPAIDTIISQGAVCWNVQAEDISFSGPCWSTILTGVHRNKHLVTSNSFIPNNFAAYPHMFARLYDVCPDLRTASIVHWAPVNNNIVLGMADVIQTYATDLEVRTAAVQQMTLSEPLSPDVMYLHFDDVDHAGHGFGFSPTIPQYIDAIQATDAHVGLIVSAIQSRPTFANEDWLIVLCSDHGGSGTSHGANTPEQRTTFFAFSGASTAQGTTLDGPLTLAEVAPTIMRFLGVSVDPSWGWDGGAVGLDLSSSPSEPVNCGLISRRTIFSENFESLVLGSSVHETPATNVWTETPPTGWIVDDTGVPGINDPAQGVTEWEGWAFTSKTWWSTVAQDQNRSLFTLGQGTIAVADCDEWADRGNPTALGTYNARLTTPAISLNGVQPNTVRVSFDSSWRQEGLQRALLTARFDNGSPVTLLDWRSQAGANFKPDAPNEAVRLSVNNPAGAATVMLEFALLDAGNNWWWAFDNLIIEGVQLCDSIDFNNDTSLFDPQDIDAFLSVYSEGPCVPALAICNDIDFNNDTSLFDPCDINSFLVVYSEGPCTPCGQ